MRLIEEFIKSELHSKRMWFPDEIFALVAVDFDVVQRTYSNSLKSMGHALGAREKAAREYVEMMFVDYLEAVQDGMATLDGYTKRRVHY